MSKVGLPGASLGLQPQDITIADALKPLGYATGQFGKNQLGAAHIAVVLLGDLRRRVLDAHHPEAGLRDLYLGGAVVKNGARQR
jgi:arylsulfatase A-like enzyme